MRTVARRDAASRHRELSSPPLFDWEPERILTHLCAGASLAYSLRVASFAASWLEVSLLDEAPATLPTLSIVVPARNEERSLERCIRSLLAQAWLDFELIVVDDGSRDETPAILERLAREDRRLRVVRGAELPQGWVGKPWALEQGARIARGEWLLFTDADSAHEPRGAASALDFALRAGVDALSIATRQELGSFWERASVPSILGMIFYACGPLGDINDPHKPDRALANGQYLLVSRNAYESLGGHAALRGEIAEDLEFARRLKADGRFRLVLAGGESLASVRMYRSLAEIFNGFTKNLYVGVRGEPAALVGGTLFLLAISAGPPALALRALARRRWFEAAEALASTFATTATATWALGRTRLPRVLGLYQPLGMALLAAITVNSTWRALSGRGVEWRGRTYGRRAKGGRSVAPRPISGR